MNISKILFAVLITLTFVSCDEMNERVLPSNTGKSGDLLVVADSAYYNNLAGEAIKQIFSQEQVGTNETLVDEVNQQQVLLEKFIV